MSKKNKSGKKHKKFRKLIGHPSVQYVGGGLISLAAIGTLKVLAERYPAVNEIFRKGIEAAEEKLDYVKEEIFPDVEERA